MIGQEFMISVLHKIEITFFLGAGELAMEQFCRTENLIFPSILGVETH